jgi:hypothetical protein
MEYYSRIIPHNHIISLNRYICFDRNFKSKIIGERIESIRSEYHISSYFKSTNNQIKVQRNMLKEISRNRRYFSVPIYMFEANAPNKQNAFLREVVFSTWGLTQPSNAFHG